MNSKLFVFYLVLGCLVSAALWLGIIKLTLLVWSLG